MQDKFDAQLLVVAGFPRTATTSIYRNLELHPGFAVPIRKELDFFRQAERPLETYKAHFPREVHEKICVDVSPLYSLDLNVPARLHALAPHARVVILVREPASWLLSVYAQICSYTANPPTFDQFVEHPELRLFNRPAHFSVKEGVYRRSLTSFSNVFGSNLLIIDFAAFARSPLEMLNQIEAFAGAARYFNAQTADLRAHNSSLVARRYPPQLRWLLSKERLVQTAASVVPAPLLRRARSMLYYEGDKKQSSAARSPESERDEAIARDVTAADQETYVEIFKTAQIRRGSDFC